MTGIYQGMIECGSPLKWIVELFSAGSRLDVPVDKLPKYGDGASLQEYSPLYRHSPIPVHSGVPYAGDYIGWRRGNDIYIAADRKGKPLSEVQKDAVYLHEVCAGFNHFRSDAEAQRLAKKEAAVLAEKDSRYVSLLDEVRDQSERLGLN